MKSQTKNGTGQPVLFFAVSVQKKKKRGPKPPLKAMSLNQGGPEQTLSMSAMNIRWVSVLLEVLHCHGTQDQIQD